MIHGQWREMRMGTCVYMDDQYCLRNLARDLLRHLCVLAFNPWLRTFLAFDVLVKREDDVIHTRAARRGACRTRRRLCPFFLC